MILGNRLKSQIYSNKLNNIKKIISKNKNFIPIPWLNNDNIESAIANIRKQDELNYHDLVKIKSIEPRKNKVHIPQPFLENLDNGEKINYKIVGYH